MNGRRRRPAEWAAAQAAAAAILPAATAAAEQVGLDATLDALLTIWVNLAVVSGNAEWAKGALHQAADIQLAEVALAHSSAAGHG